MYSTVRTEREYISITAIQWEQYNKRQSDTMIVPVNKNTMLMNTKHTKQGSTEYIILDLRSVSDSTL